MAASTSINCEQKGCLNLEKVHKKVGVTKLEVYSVHNPYCYAVILTRSGICHNMN